MKLNERIKRLAELHQERCDTMKRISDEAREIRLPSESFGPLTFRVDATEPLGKNQREARFNVNTSNSGSGFDELTIEDAKALARWILSTCKELGE